MTSSPENDPHNGWSVRRVDPDEPAATEHGSESFAAEPSSHESPAVLSEQREPISNLHAWPHREEGSDPGFIPPPQFLEFEPVRPPERIPNFGHLGILILLLVLALLGTGLLTQLALSHHLWGVTSRQKAITDIHYTLGSEGILYLITLGECLLVFPLLWHKNFFAGVQWNGGIAYHLRWRLVAAAVTCLTLALLSSLFVPGPTNAPIDKIFHLPGAPWLLFGFGVTFAPFFEETFFRGFLLPALCTGTDWLREKIWHEPRLPLGPGDHPQWSLTAMVVGAIATSIPFALLHAQQTGWSFGPFILLAGVSVVLCGVRLYTRSLAASVLVHATYNFMLFSIMLIGTEGFRHLNKL